MDARERGTKTYLGKDVLTAARERISWTFDEFTKVYVSFSGGKDSTVTLHLVMEEAIERGRKVGVLFIDMEGQYKHTIDHIEAMYDLYAEHIEPYWVAVPLILRNAVSQFEPRWICWEPDREADWIRKPPAIAITDPGTFPFYRYAMEFEEFVPEFGKWYGGPFLTACIVAIRADESLNRYRTIRARKATYEGRQFSTWIGDGVYNIYPIYDWKTGDIWTYTTKFNKSYNRIYDLMHQAGLTPHQMRLCQPYGDDQRKGLHLFHVLEPQTWPRILARVNGANQGAMYAQEVGNILGNRKITLPLGHTWESFAMLILDTMPENLSEHFKNKIAVFLKWHMDRGYPEGIPDVEDPKKEAMREVPSWRRVCKALLRNDYWCKGLTFSQTKADVYDRYYKKMQRRRALWGIL